MYFSDLYADKVVPETLHDNAEMWGLFNFFIVMLDFLYNFFFFTEALFIK